MTWLSNGQRRAAREALGEENNGTLYGIQQAKMGDFGSGQRCDEGRGLTLPAAINTMRPNKVERSYAHELNGKSNKGAIDEYDCQ